ncbi:uncharacterized protein LOC144587285 [Pogona vitticeps]
MAAVGFEELAWKRSLAPSPLFRPFSKREAVGVAPPSVPSRLYGLRGRARSEGVSSGVSPPWDLQGGADFVLPRGKTGSSASRPESSAHGCPQDFWKTRRSLQGAGTYCYGPPSKATGSCWIDVMVATKLYLAKVMPSCPFSAAWRPYCNGCRKMG